MYPKNSGFDLNFGVERGLPRTSHPMGEKPWGTKTRAMSGLRAGRGKALLSTKRPSELGQKNIGSPSWAVIELSWPLRDPKDTACWILYAILPFQPNFLRSGDATSSLSVRSRIRTGQPSGATAID
jgi:hypothetical protein